MHACISMWRKTVRKFDVVSVRARLLFNVRLTIQNFTDYDVTSQDNETYGNLFLRSWQNAGQSVVSNC